MGSFGKAVAKVGLEAEPDGVDIGSLERTGPLSLWYMEFQNTWTITDQD